MTDDAARGRRPDPATSRADLYMRIVSGASLAFIALLATVLGGWAAAVAVGIVTAIVSLEWANMVDRSPWPMAVFTAGLVVALAMITLGYVEGGLIIIGLAVVAGGLTFSLWRAAGVAYAGVLGAGLLLVRFAPDGLVALLIVFAVVWATDTGAYAAGRLIGGAKLWPAVSPNKTWAGAVGGLASGIVAGTAVALWFGVATGVLHILLFAALSVASQAGDLFESAVKRHFGVKDSGRIVPGHGGLMDRVDGLVFAVGLAVVIGWARGGSDVARGLLGW